MPARSWRSAALLSLLAVPAAAQVPDGLLGRWEIDHVVGAQADDTLPGFVPYMAFHDAGVLEIGFSVENEPNPDEAGRAYSQDGTYRVDAGTLILDIFGDLVEQPFHLDGDTLVLEDPALGITTYLLRTVGPQSTRTPGQASDDAGIPDGLVGRWAVDRVVEAPGRPDRDAATIVAVSFHEDQTFDIEFTTPEPDVPGPVAFRIADDRLFLDFDGEVEYGEIHLDGDTLTIQDRMSGSTLHLRRVSE